MPKSEAYCMDCMDALKYVPDKYFDCCVADPPYGISITSRHRSQSVQVERERAERRSLVEQDGHSVARTRVYGESRKALANQLFILCSMIAPRRTQTHLGSWNVLAKS